MNIQKYLILIIFAFIYFVGNIHSLTLPIKELVRIGSMRENQLAGYGLVVGLPQTGDTRSMLASETLKRILSFKGVSIDETDFKTKNIAVVMVTAKIPSVALAGDSIDIWVSSIGNAKSLRKGYLLQTPLSGADGEVYAVAQGSISSGFDSQSSGGGRDAKETTTFISNGAIIEKQILQPLTSTDEDQQRIVKLNLIHFDINTAQNIVNGINRAFAGAAGLRNDGTVSARIPEGTQVVQFISNILKIPVEVESKARVVVDPRSGTIVMGGNVGLSPVAVSKSGMSIQVGGRRSGADDKEKKKPTIMFLEEAPTVSQLVDVLNKLGLASRDIIDILKAVHSAGALHAELIII